MITNKQWAVITAALWVVLIAGMLADQRWLLVVATAGFAVLVVERAVNLRRSRAGKGESR